MYFNSLLYVDFAVRVEWFLELKFAVITEVMSGIARPRLPAG